MITYIVLSLYCLVTTVYGLHSNKTIMSTLNTLSPVLYQSISTHSPDIYDLFSQASHNITFLLPDESALNSSISAGTLNFTSTTETAYSSLSIMVLDGYHLFNSLILNRTNYDTLHPTVPVELSIGPSLDNRQNTIQIISGATSAYIETKDIVCTNGIIHIIDNYLLPPQSPLDTMSNIVETDYFEELLKSLNISDIISGQNKTVLAPNNAAWEKINGTSLPFGTLIHNLKYLVLDGIYFSNQLRQLSKAEDGMNHLTTNYKHYPIYFQSEGQSVSAIAHSIHDTAHLIQTDIMTTSGIIHIIDSVISVNMIDERLSIIASNNYSSNGNTRMEFESSSAHVTLGIMTAIWRLLPMLLIVLNKFLF
ncbi:FAS1 domain-containing protein [Pilobolus umbonatus]|nr:FAS1 domain-containing protein [Pilobolus umbonatus]